MKRSLIWYRMLIAFVGMKPTVCGGELCKMGFEELSLGFDLGAELRDHPQLVDLYITLAIVAAANNRYHHCHSYYDSLTNASGICHL